MGKGKGSYHSNSPSVNDYFTDFLLWTIFSTFYIYSKIYTVVLLAFFPLTKYLVKRQLKAFDIEINGDRPTDIVVHNEVRFYTRVAIEKSFGFMEGLMDKDWSTQDFKGLMTKILASRRHREVVHPLIWVFDTFNLQTKAKSFEVGKLHYDATEIIESMLDKNLQYTCGYWKDATNLNDAQIAKMELIAKKLMLKPGMKVLDIGCGYGTLAIYLAKNYGVSVVGNSISEEQIKFAIKHSKGLDCEFRLCDYRDIDDKFDRVVSVGMFEHVGKHNYNAFFEACNRNLVEDGILLLHTISSLDVRCVPKDPWVHKYIFRNGQIPYYLDICRAIEGMWIIEDLQNMGYDYSKTVKTWEDNFDKNWPKFEETYGQRFHTMWKMYLQGARACFETRSFHLLQIVLSKDGLKGGYYAAR